MVGLVYDLLNRTLYDYLRKYHYYMMKQLLLKHGLAGRKQGPPFLHKTNKHGVPHYAILVTCGLLKQLLLKRQS
jgi:hypothetical protein